MDIRTYGAEELTNWILNDEPTYKSVQSRQAAGKSGRAIVEELESIGWGITEAQRKSTEEYLNNKEI